MQIYTKKEASREIYLYKLNDTASEVQSFKHTLKIHPVLAEVW